MSYRFLTFEKNEAVALVTLNRPEKRNALSIAMREEIMDCLDRCEEDEAVKVLILTGAGASFCAGFDIGEFSQGNVQELFARSEVYHRRVHTFAKPLLAAINGPALAGGMDLAAMCDMRIASQTAVFGQPQVKMGLPAAYGLLCSVIVQQAVVRDLCLTGRRMDVGEALRIGFVGRVVSQDALMEDVLVTAKEVAAANAGAAAKAQFLKAQPEVFGKGGGTA